MPRSGSAETLLKVSGRTCLVAGWLALCLMLAACAQPAGQAGAVVTVTPRPSSTPKVAPSPSDTPASTDTPAATPTPAPTDTPTPRPTLTPRPTALSAPTLEADWQLYNRPAEGFALALPAGWLPADPDAQPPATGFETLLEHYPYLVYVFGDALTKSSFFACDLEPSGIQGGFGPCVSVVHGRPPVVPSLDQFAADVLESLDRVPLIMAGPDTQPVELPAGPAVEIRYTAGLTMPDASAATITFLTYLIVNDSDVGIVTFVVAANQFSQHAPQLQKIAGTFRMTAPDAGGLPEA